MARRLKRESIRWRNEHTFSENFLWELTMASGGGIIVYESEEVLVEGFGPNIIMVLENDTRTRFALDLTQFNGDEITKFKEVLDKAFEVAIAISLGRDKKAEELTHARKGTFRRLYRPIPRVVVGQRAIGIDGTRLLDRPVNVFDEEKPDTGESQ